MISISHLSDVSVTLESYVGLNVSGECVNTRNIPYLFKPFLRCKKKRMCIAVNE